MLMCSRLVCGFRRLLLLVIIFGAFVHFVALPYLAKVSYLRSDSSQQSIGHVERWLETPVSRAEVHVHTTRSFFPKSKETVRKQNRFQLTDRTGNIENRRTYEEIFGSDQIVQNSRFQYTIGNSHLCSGKDVFVICYIHSAPGNLFERERIRHSWGSVHQVHGEKLVYFFLIGRTKNQTAMTKVEAESHQFADIVLADFIDSYRNLTHKNLMGLRWIIEFCPQSKHILKVDDDTLVDPFHLVSFLKGLRPRRQFLLCSVMTNIGVPQQPDDKWHIPDREYPYRYYPPYCEGFAYLMSPDMAKDLYNMSRYVPYFWIDDVYVTGFLTYRLNTRPSPFHWGHGMTLMTPVTDTSYIRTHIFFLALNSLYAKHWNVTWRAVVNQTNSLPPNYR